MAQKYVLFPYFASKKKAFEIVGAEKRTKIFVFDKMAKLSQQKTKSEHVLKT